jgi:transcriptional regulator with XRE-family HTH domain
MSIGLTVKIARRKLGLTQEELGHELGVTGQAISNIERGYAPLSPKHFKAASNVLNISFNNLANMASLTFKKRIYSYK